MRRLSDFGESLFFILLGLVAIFAFKNPSKLTPENSNMVTGELSSFPKEGNHNKSDEYIGLWITGNSNFYEFSKCSLNDKIHERVKELIPGDSVILFVEKSSSSTTYSWEGTRYKTYRICDAYSKKTGQIIAFNQYNNCEKNILNTLLPIIGFIMIVIGVFEFFKKFNSKENFMDTKYLNVHELFEEVNNEYIKITPAKWSFIFTKSGLPIILLVFGIFAHHSTDPGGNNLIGKIFLIIGVYGFFHLIIIHSKIYYIIDKEGVHIKSVSYIFQSEIEKIPFNSIKEIVTDQSVFQTDQKVGTVKIHKGEYSDGDKLYSSLIGIDNYNEIADLLRKQAVLKR